MDMKLMKLIGFVLMVAGLVMSVLGMSLILSPVVWFMIGAVVQQLPDFIPGLK